MTPSATPKPQQPVDAGLLEVLIEVERELRMLVWRADRLQDTLGELIARAGDGMNPGAIEEAQAIDFISQRLTRLARRVGHAAGAVPGAGFPSSVTPEEIVSPVAGDFEAF